jgi:hypothetical protein
MKHIFCVTSVCAIALVILFAGCEKEIGMLNPVITEDEENVEGYVPTVNTGDPILDNSVQPLPEPEPERS